MGTPRPLLPALAAMALLVAAAAPAAGAVIAPEQELVTLLEAHKAWPKPDARHSTATLPASRPITGTPTVLPVVGHATVAGTRWLRIRLPGRPNGAEGWIKRHATTSSTTSWRLIVTTSSRRVRVYRHGEFVRSFSAIVGKPSTPTPRGSFFVEENIRMPRASPGAPFALALSARSEVLQEFEGGPGQIALHGLSNLGGTLGRAISHGCVRVANRNIRWLAARIPTGTPVTIKR